MIIIVSHELCLSGISDVSPKHQTFDMLSLRDHLEKPHDHHWFFKEERHMFEKEFEDKLERQLKAAGFDFEGELAIGGLRPDFLVKGPHGEFVVIEAKLVQ